MKRIVLLLLLLLAVPLSSHSAPPEYQGVVIAKRIQSAAITWGNVCLKIMQIPMPEYRIVTVEYTKPSYPRPLRMDYRVEPALYDQLTIGDFVLISEGEVRPYLLKGVCPLNE